MRILPQKWPFTVRIDIEERSGGRLKMELYWPGMLPYKGMETLNLVKHRLVDVSECTTWTLGGVEKLMDNRILFFLFESMEECGVNP